MTLENRMHQIENELKGLKKTIDEKVPTIDQMKLANRELIEEVIDKCDRRYASKETESAVRKIGNMFIGAVVTVITGSLVAVIAFLINK
jgi:regulator of replication initiation timing